MTAFAWILAAAGAVQQPAPAAAPAPCSAPEHRQLDFWIGHWDAEIDMGARGTARGENRISRGFGGCVVVEHFTIPGGLPGGRDFVGGSYSIYDGPTGSWRQMWVDNAGGMFDLRGGPESGDCRTNHESCQENSDLAASVPAMRHAVRRHHGLTGVSAAPFPSLSTSSG